MRRRHCVRQFRWPVTSSQCGCPQRCARSRDELPPGEPVVVVHRDVSRAAIQGCAANEPLPTARKPANAGLPLVALVSLAAQGSITCVRESAHHCSIAEAPCPTRSDNSNTCLSCPDLAVSLHAWDRRIIRGRWYLETLRNARQRTTHLPSSGKPSPRACIVPRRTDAKTRL